MSTDYPDSVIDPLTFEDRIVDFNQMYNLGTFQEPELPGRLVNFLKIIRDEVSEGDELLEKLRKGKIEGYDAYTELADWLGDMIVFCASEMLRHGIPVMSTLDIIMDSNESKLGEGGKPIHDPETGKVLKGPNYWKPEPMIKKMLMALAASNGNQNDQTT